MPSHRLRWRRRNGSRSRGSRFVFVFRSCSRSLCCHVHSLVSFSFISSVSLPFRCCIWRGASLNLRVVEREEEEERQQKKNKMGRSKKEDRLLFSARATERQRARQIWKETTKKRLDSRGGHHHRHRPRFGFSLNGASLSLSNWVSPLFYLFSALYWFGFSYPFFPFFFNVASLPFDCLLPCFPLFRFFYWVSSATLLEFRWVFSSSEPDWIEFYWVVPSYQVFTRDLLGFPRVRIVLNGLVGFLEFYWILLLFMIC